MENPIQYERAISFIIRLFPPLFREYIYLYIYSSASYLASCLPVNMAFVGNETPRWKFSTECGEKIQRDERTFLCVRLLTPVKSSHSTIFCSIDFVAQSPISKIDNIFTKHLAKQTICEKFCPHKSKCELLVEVWEISHGTDCCLIQYIQCIYIYIKSNNAPHFA